MGIFRLFEGPENAPFWLKKGILYFKILLGFFFLFVIPIETEKNNMNTIGIIYYRQGAYFSFPCSYHGCISLC